MCGATEPSYMPGRLRGLLGRPGPLGAVALAAVVGAVTGLLALNLVLAGWTYRNAARRDLRAPGRWALAVLLGGPLAFVPYAAVQWYRDRSRDSGRIGARERRDADETRVREAEPTDPTTGKEWPIGGTGDADGRGSGDGRADANGRSDAGRRGSGDGHPDASRHTGSLATASLRFGGKAAALGARGARWAGRRAVARMNND